MAFSLSLTAPVIRELSITASTLYLEVGRLSLFLNLWDVPLKGSPWLGISKHETGTGLEFLLGPVVLSVGIIYPTDYKALLAND